MPGPILYGPTNGSKSAGLWMFPFWQRMDTSLISYCSTPLLGAWHSILDASFGDWQDVV